ncbi:MAG TPA: HEAT repeat domain-containing protein [Aggregatilineales bacterium]|nr:HEAT repeat domain-containing protein [Aggregatilineales bacterium]
MAGFNINVWAQRLRDRNSETRAKAVQALETMGEPESLMLLGEVFATDPDPAIQAMARHAGKTIYYNLHRQQQVNQGASDEERRRAAEILAKARERKNKR